MSWWSELWGKAAAKVRDPENSRTGSGVWAGRDVSIDGALQLSTYWACTRLISETIGTLPGGMYKREKNGSKESASEHWLYSLLHDSPNGDQTAAEFWEGLAVSLCTAGNAYARKEFADDGKRLISLTPLSSEPGQMDVSRDKQGRLRYKYTFRGKAYDDTEEKIFHIRGFGAGGDLGLSPVAYARQTLGLAEAIAHSAGATFKNGMKASVFFTSPAGVKMNNDQRAEFRKAFIDPYIGAEASASAGLLEHGTDVKTVSLPPKDAEMLMSWKFSVEEICRWLRVPPILIGHSAEGQTMWGSGVEQIMLGWLTLGLRPYLTRIEQAVKKRLLSADERKIFFFEFNVEGLLRADSAGRAALYSVMAQNGLKTRNEMRSLENDPPKPGGDDLTVQSNLLPIQMLGKIPPKAVQPAPGEAI